MNGQEKAQVDAPLAFAYDAKAQALVLSRESFNKVCVSYEELILLRKVIDAIFEIDKEVK
jgi:hypothetical protein